MKETCAVTDDIGNSSKRILVVDDDESIRELCGLVLRTAGYEIETAVHGADGLERLKSARFDMVITDINMPELDGIEFYTAAVREVPSMNGMFLFMTGAATEEQTEIIFSMDLKLLEKPFTINNLLGAVEGLMREQLSDLMGGQGGSRKEGRLSFIDGCAVVLRNAEVPCTTLDISTQGIRAAYTGEPIEAGSDVKVRVNVNGLSFERRGRAIWTEEGHSGFISGIEFTRPMPVSSIINIPSREI